YVGIEADASVIMATTKMSGAGAQIYGLSGTLLLQKPGRVTPYVGLGVGLKHISSDDTVLGSDTDFPLHAGIGARFWLSNAVAIRADAKFIRGPSYPHGGSYTLNASYGEFSVGISFNPKPAPAAAAEPPVDLDPDKDGVLDPHDLCPTEHGGSN